jgi:cytochrome oxidase Cu insertion factor (SCO1/SenC/PrrC family)/ABC-type Zn2+ transport system substrate-binding protein/surface adhesin
MKRSINRLALLLLLTVSLYGTSVTAANPLHVVVSIKPIHSIVAGLMEGIEQPELLIGGKSTPYDFHPGSEQKKSMERADLVIWIGPELEASLQQPIAALPPATRVLELLANSELKVLPSRESDERRDPYFWLDSRNSIILLDELARALIDLDPARTHLYTRNRARMLKEYTRVDREFEYGYRGLTGGVIFSYYDTLQYFEQSYALKIRGLLTESPLQPIDTKRLLEARAQIKAGEYACFLTEAQLPSKHLPLLVDESSIRVGVLDSFGTRFKPGPDLYLELMRYNTGVIKECLGITEEPAKVVEGEQPITLDGRFILIDHFGRMVRSEDMLGKYQLLYFGYTSCPDVCPLSLTTMNIALKKLGDKAELLQPYFITVDPERDKVDEVRQYVEYFHPQLIGLTGSKAMIEKVARQYRVLYEKVIDDPSKPDDYQMDHTASIFLIAPDGRFLAKFAHGIMPGKLAEKIESYLP